MSEVGAGQTGALRFALLSTAALGFGLVAYALFLAVQWALDAPAEPINAGLIIVLSLGWGVAILACARGLAGRRRWARSPVVTSALVLLTVGWLLATGRGIEVWFGWLVIVVALGCVVSLLSPGVGRALR